MLDSNPLLCFPFQIERTHFFDFVVGYIVYWFIGMGVPSFFRWLLQKYPKSVVYVVEEPQTTLDGVDIPIDLSKPNPNGVEFDNLYLDMNGIIHNCTHGEHLDRIPRNEDDMFNNIFMYASFLSDRDPKNDMKLSIGTWIVWWRWFDQDNCYTWL